MSTAPVAENSEAEVGISDAAAAAKALKPPQKPRVNLFDMPELMPGAQPSANPSHRENFNQRCRQLYEEKTYEDQESRAATAKGAGAAATVADLEVMFPLLDATLIRCICADVPTPAHAIETLLALSGAMIDVGPEGGARVRATTPPPAPDIGVEDEELFPALVDKDGWQVHSQKVFDRNQEEEPGSIWRDRAKAAAGMPAPRPTVPQPKGVWGARRKQKDEENNDDEKLDKLQPLTDYELRQSVGQRKAKNRAQYGRGGRAKGSGKGGAGYQAGGADAEEASEGEEEVEVDEV